MPGPSASRFTKLNVTPVPFDLNASPSSTGINRLTSEAPLVSGSHSSQAVNPRQQTSGGFDLFAGNDGNMPVSTSPSISEAQQPVYNQAIEQANAQSLMMPDDALPESYVMDLSRADLPVDVAPHPGHRPDDAQNKPFTGAEHLDVLNLYPEDDDAPRQTTGDEEHFYVAPPVETEPSHTGDVLDLYADESPANSQLPSGSPDSQGSILDLTGQDTVVDISTGAVQPAQSIDNQVSDNDSPSGWMEMEEPELSDGFSLDLPPDSDPVQTVDWDTETTQPSSSEAFWLGEGDDEPDSIQSAIQQASDTQGGFDDSMVLGESSENADDFWGVPSEQSSQTSDDFWGVDESVSVAPVADDAPLDVLGDADELAQEGLESTSPDNDFLSPVLKSVTPPVDEMEPLLLSEDVIIELDTWAEPNFDDGVVDTPLTSLDTAYFYPDASVEDVRESTVLMPEDTVVTDGFDDEPVADELINVISPLDLNSSDGDDFEFIAPEEIQPLNDGQFVEESLPTGFETPDHGDDWDWGDDVKSLDDWELDDALVHEPEEPAEDTPDKPYEAIEEQAVPEMTTSHLDFNDDGVDDMFAGDGADPMSDWVEKSEISPSSDDVPQSLVANTSGWVSPPDTFVEPTTLAALDEEHMASPWDSDEWELGTDDVSSPIVFEPTPSDYTVLPDDYDAPATNPSEILSGFDDEPEWNNQADDEQPLAEIALPQGQRDADLLTQVDDYLAPVEGEENDDFSSGFDDQPVVHGRSVLAEVGIDSGFVISLIGSGDDTDSVQLITSSVRPDTGYNEQTVLKVFKTNPLADTTSPLVQKGLQISKEASLKTKTIYRAQLGSWKGVFSRDITGAVEFRDEIVSARRSF